MKANQLKFGDVIAGCFFSFARLPLNSNDSGFFLLVHSFRFHLNGLRTFVHSVWRRRTQSKSILIFIILIHCGTTQAMGRCSVNWKFERRWSFSMNSVEIFLPFKIAYLLRGKDTHTARDSFSPSPVSVRGIFLVASRCVWRASAVAILWIFNFFYCV